MKRQTEWQKGNEIKRHTERQAESDTDTDNDTDSYSDEETNRGDRRKDSDGDEKNLNDQVKIRSRDLLGTIRWVREKGKQEGEGEMYEKKKKKK